MSIAAKIRSPNSQLRAKALKGPYDHDVPVLAVYQGLKLKAVVFGYACHSTVQFFSGDFRLFPDRP